MAHTNTRIHTKPPPHTHAQVHPTETLEAPTVAAFSSRGPVRTDGAGMLKPDILAPGADIFAGEVPAIRSAAQTGAGPLAVGYAMS